MLSFLTNIFLSFVYYVVIEVGVYLLTVSSIGIQRSTWDLVVTIPILIATPILFILAGRYALERQGSSIKDLVSVILVCIIGFLLTPGLAFFKPHHVNLSGNEFYFLYVIPLDATIQVFKNNWGSGDLLMIGKGLIGLLPGGLCSFLPTLLMWLGLRWQSHKHPSQ